jgi:hypothetical protein
MIPTLWRDVREAYHDAVRKWVAHDTGTAISLLRLAIKRTETLIVALEKEGGDGKNSNY